MIDGIKSPEINTHIDVQLIFNKGAKIIQWRKEESSINDAETSRNP